MNSQEGKFTRTELLNQNTLEIYGVIQGYQVPSAFKRGTALFTPSSMLMRLGSKLEPITYPPTLTLAKGKLLTLILMNEATGKPHNIQPRQIELIQKDNGDYWERGVKTTKAAHSEEDGYYRESIMLRAYLSHPGVKTDHPFPPWLIQYREKGVNAWNRGAWLCREARRACFTEHLPALRAFRDERLLPTYEAFNNQHRTDKLKFPKGINREYLTLTPFLNCAGMLKYLTKNKHPVPEGFLEEVDAFIGDMRAKVKYTTINEFCANFSNIFDEAVKEFNLQSYQQKYLKERMSKVLTARNSKKSKNGGALSFDKGWPKIKFKGEIDSWSIAAHIDAKEIDIHQTLTPGGTFGLAFGPKIPCSQSAPEMEPEKKRATERHLRQATITASLPNAAGVLERYSYTFAVLQWNEFPEICHLKDWKLVERGGKAWLSLSVQTYQPERFEKTKMLAAAAVDAPNEFDTVGVDINWRRVFGATSVATVYVPDIEEHRSIFVHLNDPYVKRGEQEKEKLPAQRSLSVLAPMDEREEDNPVKRRQIQQWNKGYHLYLGCSRWSHRTATKNGLDNGRLTTSAIEIFVDQIRAGSLIIAEMDRQAREFITVSKDFVFEDSFPGIKDAQERRSRLTEMVRRYVLKALGDSAPSWARVIGQTNLRKLCDNLGVEADSTKRMIEDWAVVDDLFAKMHTFIWARVTARRDDEYRRVAHTLIRSLGPGIRKLAIEDHWLETAVQRVDKYSDPALRRSTHYRQWAAPGHFAEILARIAGNEGLEVIRRKPSGTTIVCHNCTWRNKVGSSKLWTCRNPECRWVHDQDENAASNISRPAQVEDDWDDDDDNKAA